jgi:hypothetical protein
MSSCPPRFDLCIQVGEDYDVTHTLTLKSDGSVYDVTGYTAKQEFRDDDGNVVGEATMTIDTGLGTIRAQIDKSDTAGAAVIAQVDNRLDTDILLSHATKQTFYLYRGTVAVVDRVTEE